MPVIIVLAVLAVAGIGFGGFELWRESRISEEFEELKNFITVEKRGVAQTYTKEAVERYVKWSYGDEWYFVDQASYGDKEIALKFSRANGDYFHTIIGYSNGTKITNGSVLPDKNIYEKKYRDTYEYEILQCHKDEIEQLARQLQLDVDVRVERRSPVTNAYIIINNVNFEQDSEKIAKFMVEGSKIVNYNINPEMKKTEIGLRVTANFSGGKNEPYLTFAKNQDERNEYNEEYYLTKLKSQVLKNEN